MTGRPLPRLPVGALLLLLAGLLAVSGGARAAAAAPPAWGWPLDGPHAVSRPFAPGPTPYAPGHRGADLPAAPGAVVRSAGAGAVAYAGLLAGRGVVVVVHGALRTTYEPVAPTVRVGDAVALGAPLGTLAAGHPGCPVAACLHWGLLRGPVYLDPVLLVRPPAVRLLPRAAGPPAVPGLPATKPRPPVAAGPPPVATPGPAPAAGAARLTGAALLALALAGALLRR